MGFLISSSNVKYFAKSLHCLCRLGNEIYMESKDAKLIIKTWNASRSTFASFCFENSFFEEIDPFRAEGEDQYLTCKISSKTFLQVFRSVNFIERSVETCAAQLSDNGDQLIFTMRCKHAVVKTFQVNYEECDAVQAIYTKDLSPNKLTAPSKLFLELLSNFPTSVDEITLSVSPCKVMISSYTDKEEIGKVMSTEMKLDPKEFSYFQVGIDSCISFSLRDLRSILSFAESCSAECKMSFEYEGKPFVMEIVLENMSAANFVLATIAGNDESQHTNISLPRGNYTRNDSTTAKQKENQRQQRKKCKTAQKDASILQNGDVIDDRILDEVQQGRISELLFAVDQPSQGLRKTVLADDSDEDE